MMDTDALIERINEDWLSGTGVSVSEAFTRSGWGGDAPGLLVLEFHGAALDGLREKYGSAEGKLRLNWLLPSGEERGYVVRDLLQADKDAEEGYEKNTWTFPLLFRMKEFEVKGSKPLNLCPDIGAVRSEVLSAWLYDAGRKWRKFAAKLRSKDKTEGVQIADVIRLESGLNAIFTDPRARMNMQLEDVVGKTGNPLKEIESRRQVRIDWPAESLGRLRIPHASHRNRLCPFETPESKRIGLNLHMTARAGGPKDGRIVEGQGSLLSVAVGMVPYPTHTDGPRLMMGGKNMKQAEPGIDGAEAPIVPGYYEGNGADEIEALKGHLDDDNRLTPYIGLNAMTVVMPFKGYTYEDGLVVSQSLAKRLNIRKSRYVYSKQLEFAVRKENLEDAGIKARDASALRDYLKREGSRHFGERFVYGDPLPELSLPLYHVQKGPQKGKGQMREILLSPCEWNEIYTHHAPGTLKDIKIRLVLTKVDINGNHHVDLTIKWSFLVERPLALGDKLTGRNGNKGVVTRIIPDEEMPLIHFKKKDGADEPVRAELIISPSSIMGRKNLGQLWEMTHSLLLKKRDALPNSQYKLPSGEEAYGTFVSSEFQKLRDIGADERGTFEISGDGVPDGTRAFAGWQYFCRLYHHAWKKLQARGAYGPFEAATGQPMRCGARTGQRLGEMENWSLLSGGAKDVLLGMRREQTGNFSKTRELLKSVLMSLGLSVKKKGSGLEFDYAADPSGEETLQRALNEERHEAFHVSHILSETVGKKEEDAGKPKGRKTLREEFSDALGRVRELADGIEGSDDEQGKRKKYLNTVVKRADHLLESGFFDKKGGIHVETALLDDYSELREALAKFQKPGNDLERVEGMLEYRDGLIGRLSGKEGIPRRFLLGRRYGHSGRAVIVPDSTLTPHELRLPIAMLVEILDGYDGGYVRGLPAKLRARTKVQAIVNDCPGRAEEARKLAGLLDAHLKGHPLWCFAVRQPSLHRHSVQSFRVRCWEEPVIGLPPFVTPGFNADFDGDTMAVFLPPYQWAQDLSAYAIENNPGLVGAGKSAFADGLDLALGWWAMEGHATGEKLSEYLPKFLKSISTKNLDEKGEALQRLQAAVCEASTGAATLAPLEFDTLCASLRHIEKRQENQEKAEKRLSSVMNGNNDFGLSVMLQSGAKGKERDVLQMAWAIGEIDKMKDHNLDKEEGETEQVFIPGNFWEGLTEDQLFQYSYPSRYSMAQKKLSVAEAGYLTRQLAEGLYEVAVEEGDCGTDSGMRVTYDTHGFKIENVWIPTLGNLEKDLARILWGRVPLGLAGCLKMEDIEALVRHWECGGPIDGALAEHLKENGGALVIRSPLHCGKRKTGRICPLCYGADLALKPYDEPIPVQNGFAAGLTAAQAIGERGTQLAMKRFHEVTGGLGKHQKQKMGNAISEMRHLFVFGSNKVEGELLKTLFARVLAKDDSEGNVNLPPKANDELPQALIHFETALIPLVIQKTGLSMVAGKSEGRFLSALSNERIKTLFEKQTSFTDALSTTKSRLIWEGGK